MIDREWAGAAIACCLEFEIDHFFLAPGSRCTPLTLAVAKRRDVKTTQHFDERGLAFAALGYGRATGRPGVFICTSGTAAANAFPAVIEASMESIPLILFTADRPEALRGSGANQTIEQRNLFGEYPRHFLNLSVTQQDRDSDSSMGVESAIGQLGQAIEQSKLGPVHVNWEFCEPFTITDEESSEPTEGSSDPRAIRSGRPSLRLTDGAKHPAPIEVSGNTLILLGGCQPDEVDEAVKLSERLGCPLLCDVTSGLNAGSIELLCEASLPQPDTVIHLGGRFVSKAWLNWTEQLKESEALYIHVTPTGQNINPHGLELRRVVASLNIVESLFCGPKSSSSFTTAWRKADVNRSRAIHATLLSETRVSEPSIAFHVSQVCPPEHGLFLGNSTPIRDMDWFGQRHENATQFVTANRGASGIDGLLATATGFAKGLRKPTTVLLGDLSTLHDINSLALVAASDQPLVVVVINNRAGHIFDLLPIRESEYFEKYFATPHHFDFEPAAKMFGLDYKRVTQQAVFVKEYQHAVRRTESLILEVVTDRDVNIQVRRRLNEEIRSCIASH
ncbi:MAG: 2-succinyl-5-enolpyruvyl-6-hydroxy-3-cyclohexene-1-carboxylic-acid synthase [Planctomycetota bacterium]